MADETLKRDQNFVTVLGGVTDDIAQEIRMLRVDPATNRVLASVTGASTGTVTNVATGVGLTGGPITTTGTIALATNIAPIATLGSALQSIRVNAGATALEYYTPSSGTGTVTSVSVVTANGVSGSVSTATTTPAITLVLGAITPTVSVTTPQVILTANAITATSNAATIPITSGRNIVTNNSAATLTVTLATASAVNMQTCIVQILDFSGVAQTLTLVNTENSTVTAPALTNGSTTLPLTLGFIFNSATTKWRLVASA